MTRFVNKTSFLVIAILAAIFLSPTCAGAQNLVSNGGFEAYSGTGASNIGMGLDSWTISGPGIDIVHPGLPYYWQPAEGLTSISLNWPGPSSISQTITTVPGHTYTLGFYMAAEIFGGIAERNMDVLWNSGTVAQPAFIYTGQTANSMGWVYHSYTVQGTGSDALTFSSTTPGNYGPALDGVSLTDISVPEPGGLVLLLGGLAPLLIGRGRRRRG